MKAIRPRDFNRKRPRVVEVIDMANILWIRYEYPLTNGFYLSCIAKYRKSKKTEYDSLGNVTNVTENLPFEIALVQKLNEGNVLSHHFNSYWGDSVCNIYSNKDLQSWLNKAYMYASIQEPLADRIIPMGMYDLKTAFSVLQDHLQSMGIQVSNLTLANMIQ